MRRQQERQREYLRRKWEYELAVRFGSFLYTAPREGVVIAAHRNADPDAVGAAVGLAEVLEAYGSEPVIVSPEGVSRSARRLLELLGLSGLVASEAPRRVRVAIIVDTANVSQLAPLDWLARDSDVLVVIDHHAGGGLSSMASTSIVVPEAASTSEIIAYAASILRVPLSWRSATALLAGIVSDTRNLRITGPFTFEAAGYLLDRGANLSIVWRSFRESRERDTSERIALLKAMSRLRYARACKDILIAVTHIGSFESSVARALLDLGADVAIVAKNTRNGVRISIRTSARAEENGVTALQIAQFISEKLGGEAGGHVSAAGVEIRSQTLTAEDVAERVAASVPGKVARLCTSAVKRVERGSE